MMRRKSPKPRYSNRPTKPMSRGTELKRIERAIRNSAYTGQPFEIDTLRYGARTIRLSRPITVQAEYDSTGAMIWLRCDELGMRVGTPGDELNLYKTFSRSVMRDYERADWENGGERDYDLITLVEG